MSSNTYSFKIGNFDCLVVKDYIDKLELKVGLDQMCLLVKIPAHIILIDTGWGASPDPNVRPAVSNLEAAGIKRSEIDTVLLSHAHPDHIGGNTDSGGKPLFPNASYILNKTEWDYWTSNPVFPPWAEEIKQAVIAGVRKNITGIKDRFQLVEVEGEKEILPGIKMVSAPGHTPGMVSIVLSSGREQLLYTADVFHLPTELSNLGWSPVSGDLPEQARQTRSRTLSIAASCTLVFGGHFPFPGLGRIVKSGEDFLWRPIRRHPIN